MQAVILSWSSGKDSAWALQSLRADPQIDLRGLLTTVNVKHERVAMHAVRQDLLRRQAQRLGLPLQIVGIPHPCSNELYEAAWREAMADVKAQGVTTIAFGDLFLEDVRAYRERQVKDLGMAAIFPLWGRNTKELAREMVSAGLKARLTCVDPKQLSPSFVGRDFDEAFLDDLPKDVDPCGEGGEFHTFVYDGPMFERPLPIETGEIVERGGFVFADLLSKDET